MRSGILFWMLLVASPLPCCAQAPAVSDASTAGISPLDLQSYQRELARIEAASKNAGELRELRRSLPDSWTVKDRDRIYQVPTKEISDALLEAERDPKKTNVAQLETRLHVMERHAAELALSSTAPNAAEAEAKLKKILSRAEFQAAAGPSTWDLLLARISRWILEHIAKLFRFLNISEKTGNAIAWGVILLAVALLFYVVYARLARASKGVSFRAEVQPTASEVRQWVRDALAAADRGDFREAVHCAYWASVAHLEDIRILPRDRARTPRESLRLLEQHPKEQSLLQAITRNFELIWYGYRPVSAVEWAGAKEQLEKIGCLQVSIAPTAPS
jgi:uncharacterized protein DUF4129